MMDAESSVHSQRPYTGLERRTSRRIPANYPIRILFTSESGEKIERYAHTQNVSAGGVLFTCFGAFEPGQKMEILLGVSSGSMGSLLAAKLNAPAEVVRSEPIILGETISSGSHVGLRFLEKPAISTDASIFD